MSKRNRSTLLILGLLIITSGTARALDTVEEYLREYPNQEQVNRMDT